MGIEPLDQLWVPDTSWNDAILEANAWRGRCVNAFAKAEAKVVEALVALDERSGEKPEKLPGLVGQRFGALEKLVGPKGRHSAEGAKCFEALSELKGHLPLRTFLCHGTGKIYLDRQGRWLLVLGMPKGQSGAPENDKFSVDKEEADALAKRLHRASQSLRDRLRDLLQIVGGDRDC